MGASEEAVVRRFYEEMNNGRKNELAGELFTDDHVLHDPQVPAGPGPSGVADAVAVYQQGLDGHWQIEEIFSAGDREHRQQDQMLKPQMFGRANFDLLLKTSPSRRGQMK